MQFAPKSQGLGVFAKFVITRLYGHLRSRSLHQNALLCLHFKCILIRRWCNLRQGVFEAPIVGQFFWAFSLGPPLASLRCSRTCHEIAGNTRLRNGSQKLVQTPRMDTRICVSISDWLVSYAPSDWSYSCELYHAMLKINIVACIHCIMFYKDLLCISKDWKGYVWFVRLL